MNKEKIVIISNYYPPEMGAAANRIKNMAEGLRNVGKEVVVICPLPNYPSGRVFKSYKNKFYKKEEINGIEVRRYWIFPSISKNVILRFFSMFSFACSMWFSLFFLLKKKSNIVIVQSPPIFVALSGLLISKVIKSKSFLNVSDLWPLSGFELGLIRKGLPYSILERIELFNYKLADRIIGQSEETISYIKKKVNKEFLVYRNVPGYKEFQTSSKKESFRIVYAGLLGYAQGIFNICKHIDFKELEVEFHIYGSGMEETTIIDFLKNTNRNIFFHGKLDADKIKYEILKYDVALVSLVSNIYGAVPSKIFELMQLKTPIIFSGTGEGADIVKNEEIGLCAASGDYNSLIENISALKKMNSHSINEYSKNCFNAHRNKYNLELEMIKLLKFLK